jgi:orotate phosphoribosyltransferase
MSLAARVYERAHLTGSFTLRSGAISTEYFDKYLFEGDPELLREIAAEMAALVPDGAEVLAGLELGGVPLATLLSQVTGLPTAFVRKQAKPYGTRRLAEGAEVSGRRVVVVEDVITSGGQIIASSADLRALGADVVRVLCVIDREQGGRERLAEAGLELAPLFTWTDLALSARSD